MVIANKKLQKMKKWDKASVEKQLEKNTPSPKKP